MTAPLIIAVPKGRILDEALPLLARVGIEPEPEFHDKKSRALKFATNRPDTWIIRVRAFDVATFVAHGAAQIGIVGSDVIEEFDYSQLYAPVDLDIGHCRLSVAEPVDAGAEDQASLSHVRVATKYPHLTRRHYEAQGIQAECVKLNGAMELAPCVRSRITRSISEIVRSSSGSVSMIARSREVSSESHVPSARIFPPYRITIRSTQSSTSASRWVTVSSASFLLVPITPEGPRLIQPAV